MTETAERTIRNPCPECVAGVVVETRHYATPPLGDAIWESNSRRAWPHRERSTYRVRQERVERPCCRCGGTGEKR